MSEISFEEFLKLPEEEKSEKYKYLSNHDRFLARINQDAGAVATGEKFELTEEDRKEVEEERKNWKETCKELHRQRKALEEQRKNNK